MGDEGDTVDGAATASGGLGGSGLIGGGAPGAGPAGAGCAGLPAEPGCTAGAGA